jgi:hypothetical protein
MTSAHLVDPRRGRLTERAAIWIWGAALTALAAGLRLWWVLAVPTVPVSDFAMYRESANYLSEFGRLDPGFIYMPGFVVLLAWVKDLGGDLLAQKLLGVFFGAVGAAGVFSVSAALVDEPGPEPSEPGSWRRICPRPGAAVACALYAIWPAGVAMSSVVGTDVPAAAMMVAALAILTTFGPRRPLTAALAFGATMGLAAWIRAVSLPLSMLALGYWLTRRMPIRRALLYAAAGLGATLVVLLPWGVRHLRESGELYFTDDHGGVTALIGANPNSEGTYTRALNQMFKDVTGRSVLDLPHRETDRAAYAMAREWLAFEPRYTLGMALKKAERLFDPERRLLYWPAFRPGVLLGHQAAWFQAHRKGINALADGFAAALVGLALVGLVVAAARRRWSVLTLVPFQLALIATYTIFFAEPRYRIPIQILAFPQAALAVTEVLRLSAAARRDWRKEVQRAAILLGPLALLLALWQVGWPALLEKGAALRQRHRWAVTQGDLDGRPRLVLWRPVPTPGTSLPAVSPVSGAFDGLQVTIGTSGSAGARLMVGGGPLPQGRYLIELAAQPGPLAGPPLRVKLAGQESILEGTSADVVRRELAHPGGRLALEMQMAGRPGFAIWLGAPRLRTLH